MRGSRASSTSVRAGEAGLLARWTSHRVELLTGDERVLSLLVKKLIIVEQINNQVALLADRPSLVHSVLGARKRLELIESGLVSSDLVDRHRGAIFNDEIDRAESF